MAVIKDGKSGNTVGVRSDNRLTVHAVTESAGLHEGGTGKAFNLNTGLISVVADATLVYIKNTADDIFVVEAVAIGMFGDLVYTSQGSAYITIEKNPTGGDVISDATAMDMEENRNFGFTDSFTGSVFKGKSGGTMTGGTDVAILQLAGAGRSFFPINFHLPKQASMGVSLTLNRASGTGNIYCAIIGFYDDSHTG